VERAGQADELLNGIPNMMQLQNEERYWRALAEEYETHAIADVQQRELKRRSAGLKLNRHAGRQRWILSGESAGWRLWKNASSKP
jgi:hypothetical protein